MNALRTSVRWRREDGRLSVTTLVMTVIVAVAFAVAVLGVWRAADAMSSEQRLRNYHAARVLATTQLKEAKHVAALGTRLAQVNTQERDVARESVDALLANDADRFNTAVERDNALADQSNNLIGQIRRS